MACERALGPEPEAEFGHFFPFLESCSSIELLLFVNLRRIEYWKEFFSKNNVLIIA